MKVFQTMAPAERQNLILLFIAGLLFWSSLASLLPTLPLYVKDSGATDFQVGIVMGGFAIGLLVFRPWLGRLADQRDRKIVLYIGLIAVALAPIGYLGTQSIPLLMLIRVFHGLSIAAFTTGFSALVTDLSPPQSRGEIIGYMTLVNPIGVALGPALGGFLQDWAGYTALFLISAALGLIGLIFARQLTTVPNRDHTHQEVQGSAPFWQLILSPRLRIPALVLSLIGVVFGLLAIFVPLFIKSTGVNLNPGLFYTAAAIASFSARILVGGASDRFGRGRFITMSLFLYICTFGLLWQAHSAVVFLIAGFLEGAASGIFIPMMIALAADRSYPHERGRVFGLTLAGFDLGMAIAGPIFGYFALSHGYRVLFGLSALIAALALILFVTLSSKNLSYSLKFSLSRGQDVYALRQG